MNLTIIGENLHVITVGIREENMMKRTEKKMKAALLIT